MQKNAEFSILHTLMIIIMIILVSFSVLSLPTTRTTRTEGTSIELKNRILTDSQTIDITQANEGYYLVEVDTPVQESIYNDIKNLAVIEDYIAPGLYTTKSDSKGLTGLRDNSLTKRVWRYTSETNADERLTEKGTFTAKVITFDSVDKSELRNQIQQKATILHEDDNAFVIETRGDLVRDIANIEGVEWVEEVMPFVLFNDVATVITGVAAERNDYSIYGNGEIVAVADTGLDRGVNDGTMHDDFQGRILSITDVASCGSCSTGPDDDNGHGTHVSGIALGNGVLSGSNPPSKSYSSSYAGVAPEAQLVFQAIGEDDPNSNNVYPPALISGLFQPSYNQGARVHSDSWGLSSNYGMYLSVSQDIDKFIWNNKEMNIVFAVGNEAWQGGGFKNDTTAPHASAKNVIAVGGSENYKPIIGDPPTIADNINEIYYGTGRGPTDDNRIKPDIIAPALEIFSPRSRIAPAWPAGGCTKNESNQGGNYKLGPDYASCGGTSMSTPHIAGIVTILREYYKTNEGITNPSAALIKASIINSAVDMGYGLPSNTTGWGRVNISRVLPSTGNSLFAQDVSPGLSTGQIRGCTLLKVEAGAPLKATLVWSDKYAAILAQKTLVNDLDLRVTDPAGNVYNGNDFNAPYNNEIDNTNNVEQVIIPSSMAGKYSVTVYANNVPFPQQPYALVVSYKEKQSSGIKQAKHICTK